MTRPALTVDQVAAREKAAKRQARLQRRFARDGALEQSFSARFPCPINSPRRRVMG